MIAVGSVPDPSPPRLLTQQLLGPLISPADDHGASVREAAARLPHALADLAVPRVGSGSFRLTDHHVRTALARSDAVAAATPFAWSARTARRALGLATVRALVAGEAASPLEGARIAIAQAVHSAGLGQGPFSAMDRWLAGLPPAGLAVVHADVVTWATRLWCAVDWSAFVEPPLIGRDRWWDSPHSSLLALRSRAEVRTFVSDPAGRHYSAHLVLLGGPRRSTIRAELSVVALVEARLAPPLVPPGRILGWWPESGHLVKVEVDASVLAAGEAAIARTLAAVEAPATPGQEVARAAA